MKATLQTPSEKKPELKFPLLAKSQVSNKVVLFIGKARGTVLKSDYGDIGYSNDSWVDVTNPTCWTILPPGSTVTLEQE